MAILPQKALISYPLFWEFRVILKKETRAQDFFLTLLGQKQFQHQPSSSNAKYQSHILRVWVENEEERLGLFNQLKAQAHFVL